MDKCILQMLQKEYLGHFQILLLYLHHALGLLAFFFHGFITRELTFVSPSNIMEEVNKAIAQVVIEETNQRSEVMQEHVDQ